MRQNKTSEGDLPKQLRFALEQIRPNQWERFEDFASAYLVVDYPSLRTLAGTGDRGRDAELVQPPDDPHVRIQYSVQAGWDAKLAKTAKKVADEFPETRQLVFVSNQKIGPAADELKAKIRQEQDLFVDVCDCTYFVERCALDPGRAAAAEALVADIAVPILSDRGLAEHTAPALSSGETRAACVYLALEWSDTAREKGLTKLCFEALVRSVLRGTAPDNRLSRQEIREQVADLVDATDRGRADVLTDAALGRLERRAIKRWRAEDEFCLTRSERVHVRDQLAQIQLSESELLEAIAWETAKTYEGFAMLVPADIMDQAACVRTAVETVLLRQGETFAAAVTTGSPIPATEPDTEAAVRDAMLAAGIPPSNASGRAAQIFEATTHIVLTEPSEPVQEFFRAFADAYTLFAFLRQTPDVQSAVVKLFSIGEIWLDTSILLPLLAETLMDSPARRRFTNMLGAARECGLSLHITEGVLEELEAHTWLSIQYARQSLTWRSRDPFLGTAVVMSGRDLRELPTWMEQFRGNVRPLEDLAQYLNEEHGITVGSLEREAEAMSPEIRGIVQEVWHEVHERRRGGELDMNTRGKLVAHDAENYLGVIGRRKQERGNPYGYRSWWLTLDHTAYTVAARLEGAYGRNAPDSPVMTPDFMVSYLAIGPMRAKLNRKTETQLPLSVADLGPGESVPAELIHEAKKLRGEMDGMSDRVVRRQVRDRLDTLRRRQGPYAEGGLRHVQLELTEEFAESRD
jgi:hypothetical protein